MIIKVFYNVASNNNFSKYSCGLINNLILSNDDAVNSVNISQDGSSLSDIIKAGETHTFLQANCEQDSIDIYIQSATLNNPVQVRILGF